MNRYDSNSFNRVQHTLGDNFGHANHRCCVGRDLALQTTCMVGSRNLLKGIGSTPALQGRGIRVALRSQVAVGRSGGPLPSCSSSPMRCLGRPGLRRKLFVDRDCTLLQPSVLSTNQSSPETPLGLARLLYANFKG